MITYNMSVLMGETNSGSSPKIKCNDTGVCLRIFPVIRTQLSKFRDKLEAYTFPPGSTAVLKVAKTDKTYALTDGQIEGTSVLFKLPAQACTALGKALAEVNIFGSDGRRVTTGTFVLDVVEEAVSDHSPDSQVYVDILAEYIKSVNEAKKAAEAAAERAEEAAEAAESGGSGGGQVHGPIIGEDGNWWLWASDLGQYVDSGVSAYGHTPVKGVDYFTEEDIAGLNIPVVDEFFSQTSNNAIANKVVVEYLDNMNNDQAALRGEIGLVYIEVEGIQQQINQHAHFKGYFSTNAKIQATEATPNDFAYSAESGTKWVYDEAEGWQDTGTPVPDQLTPPSEITPLMNGEAAVGVDNGYARGDHRHPTDTSRASAAELNALKSEISSALAEIISLQNSLIGGGAE